ncbi:hypothetical protein [Methylovulum psychrotolerans]|uniref:Uncharacterized protein n=1 Tax=Methylovulum psychrotolerans TaxID=1704499 RepID=A0A1Z4BU77_9GAMM|nr:hypothetical protein [Methylovulum psychrotolerans]ASF44871.1 hypothetical protein CEK71_01655 [Methylovulum psychrotolerans]
MSMDDVYERAQIAERELEHFNGRLRESFSEVMRSHDAVSPIWDDAMRREYDISWRPLQESMEEYINLIGPQYVDFLIERLRYLQAYLYGHGA